MSHKLVLRCPGNSFRACICESFVTGKLEEALQYFSEAISCNPTSAILFANRGTNLSTQKYSLKEVGICYGHFLYKLLEEQKC